eukprot:Anaeramoba_flamelloidesa332770_13.p1 GENE.a332770_13~~a332770_13.p1  ORF type:complete len:116 (+),score=5.39 a332770_13:103-450(+)
MEHISFLQDSCDRVVRHVIVLSVGDGLMKIGVKGLIFSLNQCYVEGFEQFEQLFVSQLYAFKQADFLHGICGRVNGPLKIIHHREKLSENSFIGKFLELINFSLFSLFEIFEFSR